MFQPNRLGFLAAVLILLLSACGTRQLDSSVATEPPKDCRETAKLFDSFSVSAKTATWTKETPKDQGTLTIVFTFQNTGILSSALSNSGGGYLYSVEYSLKDDNGTVYAPTEVSRVVGGKEIHEPLKRDERKDGTLKFKVGKGTYTVWIVRKYSGQPVPKYDFSCTILMP